MPGTWLLFGDFIFKKTSNNNETFKVMWDLMNVIGGNTQAEGPQPRCISCHPSEAMQQIGPIQPIFGSS